MGAFNLRRARYEVDTAPDGEQGLAAFDPKLHDLVITDLRMPGIDGLDVLRAVKARAPETPVLVITAYGNVDTAVEAMKAGAYDFVGKPFQRDHLLLTVERALESRRLREEVHELRIRAGGVERPIVFESEAMQRVLEIADRVAPTPATVLVTGETGTGKELVARRIHARSARAEGPFVAVSCAAVPSELIESELFGHEKGSFTGAAKARTGRFRQAEGGTLFLDEIGELPLALQGKLLRVLQERVVDVVGGDEPVAVDVRVIAATHQDLAERVRRASFAGICCTGSMSSRWRCRPCANDPRTSSRWCATSSMAFRRAESSRSRPSCSPKCALGRGRATCASCRMPVKGS